MATVQPVRPRSETVRGQDPPAPNRPTTSSPARRPPGYFAFASESLGPGRVREMARRHGSDMMIGVDAHANYGATLKAAREAGARLHVYLEGPGGPTGSRWDPGELRRIQRAARGQGIDTSRRDWMQRWNEGGWKGHTLNQLKNFKQAGFESAEIDNLYRALGNSPEKLVGFYREYAGWWKEGAVPRALLKNVSGPQMEALDRAIRSGELPREMFSDFAIFESSAGNPNRSARLARDLGIQTLISTNTHDYRAQGAHRAGMSEVQPIQPTALSAAERAAGRKPAGEPDHARPDSDRADLSLEARGGEQAASAAVAQMLSALRQNLAESFEGHATTRLKLDPWRGGPHDSIEGMLRSQGFSAGEINARDGSGRTLADRVLRHNGLTSHRRIRDGHELVVPTRATRADPAAPVRSQAPTGSALADRARQWVGRQFKPGQTRRCADFVSQLLRESGSVPPGFRHQVSVAGLAQYGRVVDRNKLLPGDVVMFGNTYRPGRYTHTGIYIGNGQFVHRRTAGGPVRIDSLDSGYYRSRYTEARRMTD